MLAVVFYLSCLGLFLAVSLLGPVFIAVLAGEYLVAQRFGVYLLLGSFVFGGGVLAIMHRTGRVPQVGRLILVLLVWTVMPVAAAIPIADISNLGFVDALFESMSGLTTTGSSVLKTVDAWPQALIFWRVQLQWIGGFLTLLTIILILAPLGVGGLTGHTAAFTGGNRQTATQTRLLGTTASLGLFYAVTTLICTLGLMLAGTRPFYALTLAMTAVSTGGFLPFDVSLDSVLSMSGLVIFAIFLMFGATSVLWQRMFFKGRWSQAKEHRESYFVLLLVLFLALAFSMSILRLGSGSGVSPGSAFVEGLLNAASLVATSGVETRPGVFSIFPLVLILFLILVGGSAFSTSGGLKHYRLGAMLVQSWSELDRLVYPNAVRSSRFGSQPYDLQLMKAIWSFFVAAILTIGIGTIVVAIGGIPFEAALTATIATFSTAGPVYEAGWAPIGEPAWPSYSEFPTMTKGALIFIMLLGRLEVLSLVALLSARYWKGR